MHTKSDIKEAPHACEMPFLGADEAHSAVLCVQEDFTRVTPRSIDWQRRTIGTPTPALPVKYLLLA